MKSMVVSLVFFLLGLAPFGSDAFVVSFPSSVALGRQSLPPLCAAAPKKKTSTTKEETFKKADFISSMAEKTGLSKTDSETALMAVLDTISEQVMLGKRITLSGFGTFKLSERAARKGRNPQTGEEIDIKASKSMSFSAAKGLKEKLNA